MIEKAWESPKVRFKIPAQYVIMEYLVCSVRSFLYFFKTISFLKSILDEFVSVLFNNKKLKRKTNGSIGVSILIFDL